MSFGTTLACAAGPFPSSSLCSCWRSFARLCFFGRAVSIAGSVFLLAPLAAATANDVRDAPASASPPARRFSPLCFKTHSYVLCTDEAKCTILSNDIAGDKQKKKKSRSQFKSFMRVERPLLVAGSAVATSSAARPTEGR